MCPYSEADQENSDHDELERLRRYRERLQSLEKLRNDANLEVEDRKLELKEAKEHAKICERNLQRAVRGDDEQKELPFGEDASQEDWGITRSRRAISYRG